MTDVLHLSARDNLGGAARAAYRLHEALRTVDVNSRMYVGRKVTDDDRVDGPTGRLGAAMDVVRRQVDQLPVRRYRDRDAELFSPAWVPDRRERAVAARDPDVVHLHWVAGGFLRPETVAALDMPTVWTLHDMWAFTGGCHYAKDCERFVDRCGACPHLGSDHPEDLSRRGWKRKRDVWDAVDAVVAPSRWLAERAEASSLFGGRSVSVVPNPLDTEFWRPQAANVGRERYDLPDDAKVVLFGADYGTRRKGADLLTRALRRVAAEVEDLLAVVFGGGDGPDDDEPFACRTLGRVSDEGLRDLYGAADVVAVPSRQEAFGQTASEAAACGTPVAAFDATGLSDVIVHDRTGYLAEPFDPDALATGIRGLLKNDRRRERLGRAARERAVERFGREPVADQYAKMYRSVQ